MSGQSTDMGKKPPPPKHDDSGGFFSSSMARASDHFAAKDREDDDGVTRFATLIGRGLSLIAFIGLAWYFGHQLKWW